jgi:acetyl esterase/lipase
MTLKTKIIYALFKLVNAKKIATGMFLKPARSSAFDFPKRLKKKFQTHPFTIQNRTVVTFEPGNSSANKHILLLHGGAYAAEASNSHWRLIEHLVEKTHHRLSFIDYPLIPENTYREAHEMVLQAYARLVEMHPNDTFVFIGDSAGGGFCLSLAQIIRDRQSAPLPEKLLLLSPWIDLSLSNPEIPELEKKDLLLDPASLLICSQRFANGLDLKDPVVSPLYGTMDNLNNIGIFVGTHEIFLPDCRTLKRKVEESNTVLHYKEYEAMQHDWMIFPIKERKILLNDVVHYLLNR